MHVSGMNHVTIDDKGVARIDDSRLKVLHVVEVWMASEHSAEAVLKSYPFLTPLHVQEALAYYREHQAAFDAKIERDRIETEAARAANLDSPMGRKLRALKAQRQQQRERKQFEIPQPTSESRRSPVP
jgi:uncharacterized protein (DUF433 family)